jgi:hypothetical protein
MMKKLLFSLLFLCLHFFSFGQSECGILPYSENLQKKSNVSTTTNISFLNPTTPFCVNVRYHIVRQSNGTGGFNASQLDCITENLNKAYDDHNIHFVSLGYDYIDNTTYYSIDDNPNSSAEFDALTQINNDPYAINIYFVDNAPYAGSARYKSNYAVVMNDYATGSTTPHEVGHCFDLIHTHGEGGAMENSGNCTTAGDKVCDTPPDPTLNSSNVDDNCSYTGGGGYNPDTRNIMSYSKKFCRDRFTAGQNTRMRQAFASSSTLQNVVSTSCQFLAVTGSDRICTSGTYTIANLPTSATSVTWTVTGSIAISGSNTGTTVSVVKSNYGSGTLTASFYTTCGSYQISKQIEIVPSYWPASILGEPYTVSTNTSLLPYASPGHPDATSYTWELSPSSGGMISANGLSADLYIWIPGSYTVTCTAQTPCGTVSIYTYYDVVSSFSAIASYPNPANTELIVERKESSDAASNRNRVQEKPLNISLYNNKGENVSKGSGTSQVRLNTSTLPNGTYFLHYKDEKGKLVRKQVIIQH